MSSLVFYLKYDISQILKSRIRKIYYIVLISIVLIDTLFTYFSNSSLLNIIPNVSSYSYFLLESSYGIISKIYCYIFPIIAIFPFALQYYIETKHNFHISLITRGNRWNYLLSKFIISFFIGFLTIFSILMLNYIITILIYPFLDVIIAENIMVPDNGAAFEKVFYQNIYVYNFIYILINAFIGGLFSAFAFALSLIIKYKNEFIVIAVPFIIYTAQSIIFSFINPRYDILHIIQPKTRFALISPITNNHISLSISIWCGITILLFFIGYKKGRDLL